MSKRIISRNVYEELVKRGLTIQKVADELGCSASKVSKDFKLYNLDTKDKKQHKINKSIKRDDLIPLINKGFGIEDIAKSLNIMDGTVFSILKKFNLKTLQSQKNAIGLPNKKFGRLTVLERLVPIKDKKFRCLCECGKEKVVTRSNLISGNVRSCGCYAKELQSIRGTINGPKNSKTGKKAGWYFIQNGEKIKCSSGYEVIYANYLLDNNIDFQYEPKIHKIKTGIRYTPDFYIPKENLYIEIKGFDYPEQIEKRSIFKESHNLQVVFWDDLVKICSLPPITYPNYLYQARKMKISAQDYMSNRLYLQIKKYRNYQKRK